MLVARIPPAPPGKPHISDTGLVSKICKELILLSSLKKKKKKLIVWLSPFAVHLKLSQHCSSAILQYKIKILIKKIVREGFPGGPVIKTSTFHCREHGFDHWLGNEDNPCFAGQSKQLKKKINGGTK